MKEIQAERDSGSGFVQSFKSSKAMAMQIIIYCVIFCYYYNNVKV